MTGVCRTIGIYPSSGGERLSPGVKPPLRCPPHDQIAGYQPKYRHLAHQAPCQALSRLVGQSDDQPLSRLLKDLPEGTTVELCLGRLGARMADLIRLRPRTTHEIGTYFPTTSLEVIQRFIFDNPDLFYCTAHGWQCREWMVPHTFVG